MFANLPKYKIILRIVLVTATCGFLGLSTLYLKKAHGDSLATVYLNPSTQKVAVGQEVIVNINISNVQNLFSFQLSLNYDPNLLQYKGISEGNFLNQNGSAPTMKIGPEVTPGQVLGYSVSRQGINNGIAGSGNLATLRFLALKSGTTNLNFITSGISSLRLLDPSTQVINRNYSNGQVTITGNGSGNDDDNDTDTDNQNTQPAPGQNQNISAKFNFMNADNKTLRVKNRTRNDNTWLGAISAQPGDRVAFNIYYHNGVEGSTSHNTKIKLIFPQDNQNVIVVQNELKADNAATVYDSTRITLPNAQQIQFANTAQWYPDRKTTNPQNINISKSGNALEINIGDINGCWENQGQVIIEANLTNQVATAGLAITGQVKNLSQQSGWSNTANARLNEELQFRFDIAITNNTAFNLALTDLLPQGLTYKNGSLEIVGASQKGGDLFGANGLQLGDVTPGQITVYFKGTVNNVNQISFTNRFAAKANNATTVEQSSTIVLSQTGCSILTNQPIVDVN